VASLSATVVLRDWGRGRGGGLERAGIGRTGAV